MREFRRPRSTEDVTGDTSSAASDRVRGNDAAPRRVTQPSVDDSIPLAPAERIQLEQDIAEIERAAAALRKAEPNLETWTLPPAVQPAAQPRSVWLLVGALWLSTALVTIAAVIAIAALVG